MEKKTNILIVIAGIVIVVAVLLAFILESGTNRLTSNDILRINDTVYHKDEFEDFIRYTLYNNNGEFLVEDDGHDHTEELEQGATEEGIFISDCLNSFYSLKVYEIIANEKNISLTSGEIDEINNSFNDNKSEIEANGLNQDRFTYFETLQAISNKINSDPTSYLELPDGVYDSYIESLSGDDLKSYTYRIMQVNYTEDETSGDSGEIITSGDKEEKREFINSLVARVKAGEAFETVAESGDSRIISVGNSITFAKSALEHSAGSLLEQKISMFTGNTDLSNAIKQTASGELTEVIDIGNAFQVALVENVEDGIVGESKDDLIEAMIGQLYNDIVYSYVNDMEVNQSAVSRIKIQ